MVNNQVELGWVGKNFVFSPPIFDQQRYFIWQVTGEETDNLGYIVEKRPSYGGDFQEIASFNEVTQLQSKGASGGRWWHSFEILERIIFIFFYPLNRYRYVDPSTVGGSWIYRVKDCDQENNQNVLCQCFVEVQTDNESKSQSVCLQFFANSFSLLSFLHLFFIAVDGCRLGGFLPACDGPWIHIGPSTVEKCWQIALHLLDDANILELIFSNWRLWTIYITIKLWRKCNNKFFSDSNVVNNWNKIEWVTP